MTKRLRIRTKRPWIGYPATPVQQGYAEDLVHGYLLWDINDERSFDVKFCELPNLKPYVTISWSGTPQATLADALKHPTGSRFRIHTADILSQKDVVTVSSLLRQHAQASEVTFKTDQNVQRDIVSSGDVSLTKKDLRNPEALMMLLKDHYRSNNVTSEEWLVINDLLKSYLQCASEDEVVRNAKWSLKRLEFDNVFGYGEGNIINFDELSGIVGVFGPNRAGKSSIVGALSYALFNSADRGSFKNLYIINARKLYCRAKAIVSVNGINYVIERQTTKNENKQGKVNAATALNVFRMDGEEAIDLAGEQRSDTEKVLRKLLGSFDDIKTTSLSAQGDTNQYIEQGSSKRHQLLSRFLDLDVFDKMYELGKNDLNECKAVLKNLPGRDWKALEDACNEKLEVASMQSDKKQELQSETQENLASLRSQLAAFSDFTPITPGQVATQRATVSALEKQAEMTTEAVESCNQEINKIDQKLVMIDEVLSSNDDINKLKQRVEALRVLETSVTGLKHICDREATSLKQHEKSIKILDDVPCGDSFPSCKFIKDAHASKQKIDEQRSRVVKEQEKLEKALGALELLRQESAQDKLRKLEAFIDKRSKLRVDVSNRRTSQVKLESMATIASSSLEAAKKKLVEMELALAKDENVEVVALRSAIDEAVANIKKLDIDKLTLASDIGRTTALLEKLKQEQHQRDEMLHKMRAYELVTMAFSRRGIPNIVIASQLPLINAEISKVLYGIVDFVVELEADTDSDSIEAYINYGDSRRIIETCSGMEKFIASVAIRVALTNVSSLPKTDMLVIDEGFGSMDPAGIEACNRLLVSLKRYFRIIMIMSHAEGVKDAVDNVIEIGKREKDAYVVIK